MREHVERVVLAVGPLATAISRGGGLRTALALRTREERLAERTAWLCGRPELAPMLALLRRGFAPCRLNSKNFDATVVLRKLEDPLTPA